MQRGKPNNSGILKTRFPPQEVRFPLLNLRKFHKTEKSTSESYKIVLNLMSDKDFGFFEFLQLK